MLKLKIPVIVFAFFFLFSLTACTNKSVQPGSGISTEMITSVPGSPTGSPDQAATQTGNPDIESFILEKLQGHHSIDRVLNAKKTRAEWEITIDRMISYGANINDSEKQLIIDWLVSRNQ